jgi:hypothetical protein
MIDLLLFLFFVYEYLLVITVLLSHCQKMLNLLLFSFFVFLYLLLITVLVIHWKREVEE